MKQNGSDVRDDSFWLVFIVAVRLRVGLLRAADPGDRQLQEWTGIGYVLRVRDAAWQLGALPASLQHLLPRLPQGVPEQRHFHRFLLLWQHFEPRAGRQLLHPRRPGPCQRQARRALHIPLDGEYIYHATVNTRWLQMMWVITYIYW